MLYINRWLIYTAKFLRKGSSIEISGQNYLHLKARWLFRFDVIAGISEE